MGLGSLFRWSYRCFIALGSANRNRSKLVSQLVRKEAQCWCSIIPCYCWEAHLRSFHGLRLSDILQTSAKIWILQLSSTRGCFWLIIPALFIKIRTVQGCPLSDSGSICLKRYFYRVPSASIAAIGSAEISKRKRWTDGLDFFCLVVFV